MITQNYPNRPWNELECDFLPNEDYRISLDKITKDLGIECSVLYKNETIASGLATVQDALKAAQEHYKKEAVTINDLDSLKAELALVNKKLNILTRSLTTNEVIGLMDLAKAGQEEDGLKEEGYTVEFGPFKFN